MDPVIAQAQPTKSPSQSMVVEDVVALIGETASTKLEYQDGSEEGNDVDPRTSS
jgi:hypothetical protein